MSKIKKITAREIKDSRGNPTVEVELETVPPAGGGIFIASVPSGASTGKNEALELRDADGKGVLQAIKNVNEIIAPKLKNLNPENQQEIDKIMIELDDAENKSKLGANAILAVSMAVCRAGAAAKKIPLYSHVAQILEGQTFQSFGRSDLPKLPLPMFNILEGGAHVHPVRNGISNGASLDIQEFIIVPQKKTFTENLILCNKVFQNLKDILNKNYGGEIKMGDEGGFAPPISKTEQALYLLKNAIEENPPAGGVKIAIDCAASEFFKNGKYSLEGQEMTRVELVNFYEGLVKSFPIISIEDPFAEEDWQGFASIVRQMGDRILVIGDDLTTTNIKRIREAHSKQACNGVIIKLNQIGSVSETLEAVKLAQSYGWKIIVSHRSGETMDDFIADLAVGVGADFLKAGSPAKEERMVKYNRLLQIEQEI